MRAGLLGSLLLHVAAAGAAWHYYTRPTARTEAPVAAFVAAALEEVPLPDPEPPEPKPPEPDPVSIEPIFVEDVAAPPNDFDEPETTRDGSAPLGRNDPPPVRLRIPFPRRQTGPPAQAKVVRPAVQPRVASSPSLVAKKRPRAAVATPPRLLRHKSPRARYPSRARRMGLEGRVVLLARISATGLVIRVTVAESSGSPLLDRAAVAEVKRWVFEPARRGKKAVPESVRVPVEFSLR